MSCKKGVNQEHDNAAIESSMQVKERVWELTARVPACCVGLEWQHLESCDSQSPFVICIGLELLRRTLKSGRSPPRALAVNDLEDLSTDVLASLRQLEASPRWTEGSPASFRSICNADSLFSLHALSQLLQLMLIIGKAIMQYPASSYPMLNKQLEYINLLWVPTCI